MLGGSIPRGVRMRRVLSLVMCAVSVAALVGCTSKSEPAKRPARPSREASEQPKVEQTVPVSTDVSLSAVPTVPTPTDPRILGSGNDFSVDADGRGRALARFKPPMHATRSKPGWARIVSFEVDQTKVDGVWVSGLTFSGRITEDTIITRSEQKSFGSGKFPTVSRRIGDIIKADPKWAGPTPGARVKVAFFRKRSASVVITTITEMDVVLKSVRLPDAKPVYEKKPKDGLLAEVFEETGAYRAEIVGYIVDFKPRPQPKSGEWIREFVVDKNGERYLQSGWFNRPYAAWGHPPQPRVRPESEAERSAQERAVARASKDVRAESGPVDAPVYAYVVRVWIPDGTSGDIIVDNAGRVGYDPSLRYIPPLTLQPWSAYSKR